jgi:hypothetical protein
MGEGAAEYVNFAGAQALRERQAIEDAQPIRAN